MKSNQLAKRIIFNAETWIYERKNAFPMVDCITGSADGIWKNFSYHPECNGNVLNDNDVIILNSDGTYSVESKDQNILNTADEAKFYAEAIIAERYIP